MRKLTSVALVGALAMAAASVATGNAEAGGKRHSHHHYYGSAPYDPGAAIVTGAIVGLTFGTLAAPVLYPPYYGSPAGYGYAPPPPPYFAPASGNPHMDWCEATYETYDPETNLWTDYRGVPHQCVGPF
jgi:hypothetical protein